jgi:hypothetical protein
MPVRPAWGDACLELVDDLFAGKVRMTVFGAAVRAARAGSVQHVVVVRGRPGRDGILARLGETLPVTQTITTTFWPPTWPRARS